MKLLVVLGEGGHTKEMLSLVDLLGPTFEYSYLLTYEDELSAAKIQRAGPQYRVTRPRSKDDNALVAVFKVLRCAWQSWRVLRREQPDAIISCGPAVALPISFWGKLLNKAIIFIETGSRVKRLSLSGKLMRHLADLYFVQWPQLCEVYPKAIYAGRLF